MMILILGPTNMGSLGLVGQDDQAFVFEYGQRHRLSNIFEHVSFIWAVHV